MLKRLDFIQYNFKLINFNSILRKAEINIVNDLYKYHLLKDRITTTALS